MSTENSGVFAKFMKTVATIEPNELKATLASFLFVFLLMVSYTLLRPMRDAMAPDWGNVGVAQLWTINFFISTAIVALYGFAVTRVPFRKLVSTVYAGFASSFFIFFLLSRLFEDVDFVNKCFYVWVSVFALFNLSVFWGYMADIFNQNQARRLFAIIATGASVGAIVGPILSALLAKPLDAGSVMLISAFIMMLPIPLISYLRNLKENELGNAENQADLEKLKIGGNPLSGFKDFFSNPYLLGIGAFIFLYTGMGTFLYMQQNNLLAPYDTDTRELILSVRDLVVNVITFALGIFATSRIVTKLGMPSALAIVPLLMIVGMSLVAFSPGLTAVALMWVGLRAGNYGLTRPAREMLFTIVARDDRFKTKPVIDVACYRGGDVMYVWLFALLSDVLALTLAVIAIIGALISGIWAYVGYKLGVFFDSQGTQNESNKQDRTTEV